MVTKWMYKHQHQTASEVRIKSRLLKLCTGTSSCCTTQCLHVMLSIYLICSSQQYFFQELPTLGKSSLSTRLNLHFQILTWVTLASPFAFCKFMPPNSGLHGNSFTPFTKYSLVLIIPPDLTMRSAILSSRLADFSACREITRCPIRQHLPDRSDAAWYVRQHLGRE